MRTCDRRFDVGKAASYFVVSTTSWFNAIFHLHISMKSLRRNQGAGEENTWEVGFLACASSGICDMEVRFTSTYRPPQGIVHKKLFICFNANVCDYFAQEMQVGCGLWLNRCGRCLAFWVKFGKSKLFNATPLLILLWPTGFDIITNGHRIR